MNITTDAHLIYKHFKQLPGSQFMASEHAIGGLIYWLKKRKPKTVLEVGTGIGTLTFTCVAALSNIHKQSSDPHKFKLLTIEDNDFCLTELEKNLKDQRDQFELFQKLPEPPAKVTAFDFVIIDGGNQNPNFVSNLEPRAIVFIEGYMDKKHQLIAETHKERKWVRTNFRSRDRKAGYWIFLFEPTNYEIAWFSLNNFINRVYSGVKRRLKPAPKNL